MSKKSKGSQALEYDYDFLYLIPIVIFSAIIPLIVYMHPIKLTEIEINNWTGGTESYDFFSYWKSVIVRATGALSILCIVLKVYTNKFEIKKTNYYIPMAVYSLFVILSAMLSPYKEVASRGYVDRFEGVYVILTYILMMFATINFVKNEKHVKIVTIGILVSAIVLGVIGILQFIGIDIFERSITSILPDLYKPYADEFSFNFGKYNIYSTLYNTNYVGSYMVMSFSISLVIFLYIKKIGLKIATGLLTCLMFANLIGCRSRAGAVGAIFSLLIMLIVYRKVLKRNLIYIGGIAALCVAGFVVFNAISHGTLLNKYVAEVKTLIESVTNGSVESTQKNPLKDIQIYGNELNFITDNEELNFIWQNDEFLLYDNNGNSIDYSINEDKKIVINDKRYSGYSIKIVAANAIDLSYSGMYVRIAGTDDGKIVIVGERGNFVNKLDYPESFGFKDREKFASNRGYIWSKSIPMLKKSFFVGSGPDTYAIVFPQKDYVGKLRAFGNVNIIVDKPHNMYLQIGINTGVLSMLAIIALFIMYFISSIKLYFNNKFEDKISYLGFGMFAAFCGYAVTGLFNDSIVSVAPVFWVVLGLGICCNYMVRHPETFENKIPGKKNKVSSNTKK
jgi:O-antigen ligase